MQRNNKKKICIITSSLGKGGAEKSMANISVMLDQSGYNIFIVSVLDNIIYNYRGQLLNLGIIKSRFKKFQRLKRLLKKENFDYIIDGRSRPNGLKELFISKLLYRKQKVIYIVHSYLLESYFPKNKIVSRKIYKNAYKIIAVSKAIKSKLINVYHLNNVEVIYNAINLENDNSLAAPKNNFEYILFYGRLVNKVKNINLLIEAYKLSKLRTENIKLLIIGNGPDEMLLKNKVTTEKLSQDIRFLPYMANPIQFVKQAVFCILTSNFEGFPMVIAESLSVGTPYISVDCKSGPNEIIINKENGLLVENHNTYKLAQAMNNFIFDKNLYNYCKSNTKDSVAHLNMHNIVKDWIRLFKD